MSQTSSPSCTAIYGPANFQAALSFLGSPTLNASEFGSNENALIFVARAFCDSSLCPLSIYRAASSLREGHVREIVQLLVYFGPNAIPATIRLLTIMRGLPGNDELVLSFLKEQTGDQFAHLDTRTLVLISFLAGPKMPNFCDCASLVKRAKQKEQTDINLALSFMFETVYQFPVPTVLRVFDWASEDKYSSPSFWRELQWAAFARSQCISNGITPLSPKSGRSIFPNFFEHASESVEDFEPLPPGAGPAASHYVRVRGILLNRRELRQPVSRTPATTPATTSSKGRLLSISDDLQNNSDIVLTSTLRKLLRQIAAAIAYGFPFILEGPTGCGKTAILSHLAQHTVFDGADDFSVGAPGVTFIQMDSVMVDANDDSLSSLIGGIVPLPEGGGFRWRPGPIGLAVERGEWIVIENIGRSNILSSATPVLQKLAELRPGDTLEASGRGEPIPVGHGFRCVATRTTEGSRDDSWEPPGGWELWLRLPMEGLAQHEVTEILCERFPSVSDCIERVVNTVTSVVSYTNRHNGPNFIIPTMREALRICRRLGRVRNDIGDLTPEMALHETLDSLVAWCPEPFHRLNMIEGLAQCWSVSSDIGKNFFSTHCPTYSDHSGVLRIGRAQVVVTQEKGYNTTSLTLSLNGHTLRLMEQVLRCLQLEENVMLTGEAGSGKTAVIQELASLLGKKLVIINLSRQSELGDLLGGFRPIEVSAAVPQLAKKFERVFGSCMSKEKNTKFLDALQRATRSTSHHVRALRLIRGAMKAVPSQIKKKTLDISQSWDEVATELRNLESLVVPATNVSVANLTSAEGNEPPQKKQRAFFESNQDGMRRVDFKFSEGVLVQAMRAGHWVLLDEINLAPAELLERLISILDRGQVLLPNVEGEVVTKSPGFVLFGAMNPPTDVGKRPLPPVLRARFTEFHVGDITDRKDVASLVLNRFFKRNPLLENSWNATREEFAVSEDVTSFFLECCELAADGRVEDTSGKPVRFSVRTLVRMLDFASGVCSFLRHGFDYVRRALYEGALVAFGTSLPRNCKTLVTDVGKTYLLRNVKGMSKRRTIAELTSVPGNSNLSIRLIEGFPIEVRDGKVLDLTRIGMKFVESPTVKQTLRDVCRVMLVGAPKFPVLLQGPTAAGKTSLVTHLAHLSGNELVRINNHEHTELSEYIGGYVAASDGSLVFCEGPVVRAARLGHWILLDELNLAPPDVLESLNRLLDDNREILITETGEVVKAADGFRLFATQNPPGLYGGRKELSRAFRSRFVEVQVDSLPDDDLLMILERRASIPQRFARGMISVMRELQLRRRSTSLFAGREGYVTARDLFRWSARQPRSKGELAVHGFFVLGERERQESERESVREVIIKTLGIPHDIISDESLYILDHEIGKESASQECLDVSLRKLRLSRQKLVDTLSGLKIVATPHMRRMITLIIHCMAHQEPALLVGATGSGKTSCCSTLCAAMERLLLTVNCHRHTEASDIVGGFRPVRKFTQGGPMFEWRNGPLINAMTKGNVLLVDEVNMADDAVVERLNSVLELERSFLLSEKGTSKADNGPSPAPELVKAAPDFLILATMNPGGDFGKKELSPALRNRFTEMWIPQPMHIEDYTPIISQRLSSLSSNPLFHSRGSIDHVMIDFVRMILSHSLPGSESGHSLKMSLLGSFAITLRDLKAWCDFIVEASSGASLDPCLALVHGARLVFLDGMCVGSMDNRHNALEGKVWNFLLGLLPDEVRQKAELCKYHDAKTISLNMEFPSSAACCMEVGGFALIRNRNCFGSRKSSTLSFSFEAPNTIRNTARLARAMCVGRHPVLLEGPPGGGKTSLVAALAAKTGHPFIRVNLSESTEMSDLVGTDAPGQRPGMFVFHEGPLLQAVRNGSWLLLDELNLASQSVLEGLNSVLDHRRSLFVPETNEEVTAKDTFRVFGAQNPAIEGSGRRGLPKSFLNRFTKVAIEPPDSLDILSIVSSLHAYLPPEFVEKIVTVLDSVKSKLVTRSAAVSFGLRDALRWCDLVSGATHIPHQADREDRPMKTDRLHATIGHFFDVVVLQGLPIEEDRAIAEQVFKSVFGHHWQRTECLPTVRPVLDGHLRIGIATTKKSGSFFSAKNIAPGGNVIALSRLRELNALFHSIKFGWSTVLFSGSSSRGRFEARKLVEQVAVASGKSVRIVHGGSLSDFDDFIGGYTQQDAVWIIRNILTAWHKLLRGLIHSISLSNANPGTDVLRVITCVQTLLSTKAEFADYQCTAYDGPHIIRSFCDSSSSLLEAGRALSSNVEGIEESMAPIERYYEQLGELEEAITTGKFASFEWRKSDLLSAIESGDWILVEDADHCPPAVLDRLNPLFERPPVHGSDISKCKEMYPDKMLLAEAPSRDDGSPVHLEPHSDFRMIFSVSSDGKIGSQSGLSRALLDRSLRIYVGDNDSSRDRNAVLTSVGFSDHEPVFEVGANVPPFLQTKDVYTRAVRFRFFMSVNANILCGNEAAGLGLFKPMCAGTQNDLLPVSACEIPRTTMCDMVIDSQGALIERDLCFLRFFESFPSDTIKKSLLKADIYGDSGNGTDMIHEVLCETGAMLFLFGSGSAEDFRLRVSVLEKLLRNTSSPLVRNVYNSIMTCTKRILPLRYIAEAGDNAKFSCGTPIDPVFALDASVTILREPNVQTNSTDVHQRIAKEFRMDLATVQRLLENDDRMRESKNTSVASLFVHAKRVCDLRDSGVVLEAHDLNRFELLSYEIVKTVLKCRRSICEHVQKTIGWVSEDEDYWTLAFSAVSDLCNCLAMETDSKSSVLLAPLAKFHFAMNNLKRNVEKFYVPAGLSKLMERTTLLMNRVEQSLKIRESLMIPATSNGFEIEHQIIEAIKSRDQDNVLFSEIDSAAKAILSIRKDTVERNAQIVGTFEKLAEALRGVLENRSSALRAGPVGHWPQITHCASLNALNSVLGNVLCSEDVPGKLKVSKLVESALVQTKCNPVFSFNSVISVQRLSWLWDCEESVSHMNGERMNPIGNYKPFISSILRESAYLLVSQSAKDSTHDCHGVAHAIMKSAEDGSQRPFLDLSATWQQSISAFYLVTRGMHIADFVGNGQGQLLFASLASVLSDGNFSNNGEAEDAQKLLNNLRDLKSIISFWEGLLMSGNLGHLLDNNFVLVAIKCFKQISASETVNTFRVNDTPSWFLHLGILWVCIGLVRLQIHHGYVEELNGMDPSEVAQSLMKSSSWCAMESSAAAHVYDIVGGARLGGEDPSNSVPVSRLLREVNRNHALFEKARRRSIYRSSRRASFKSYQNTVSSTISTLLRAVCQNQLLSKCDVPLSVSHSRRLADEIALLRDLCETVAESLECGGSLSHFRDLSSICELGLRECIFGFACLSKGLNGMCILADRTTSNKLQLFADLSLFPRACFPSALSLPHVTRSGVDLDLDGVTLLSLVWYHSSVGMRAGEVISDDLSRALGVIVDSWKRSKLQEEADEEYKTSIHVLRKASEMDENGLAMVVGHLKEDEEGDFINTFNPMKAETEEALLGIAAEHYEDPMLIEKEGGGTNEVCRSDLRVDPEEFWKLHTVIFPPNGKGWSSAANASSGLDRMHVLASRMFAFLSSVTQAVDYSPNIWSVICASRVMNQFVRKSDDESSYNFYTDNNVTELASASAALQSLHQAIENIQKAAFKDIGSHPVLAEVSIAVERIAKSCKSDAPLSTVIVGIEGVLRKADEWHRLFAIKQTRLDETVARLSRLALRWRKMEMTSWPLLLKGRRSGFIRRASQWFFLLYDAVVNHCLSSGAKSVESRSQILSSIDQFLRSAPCGEFSLRIEMILSLARHLSCVAPKDAYVSGVARLLKGIGGFYAMYIAGVESFISDLEKAVYKKLAEFAKLVTWTATEDLGSSQKMVKEKNKYLEYFRLKEASEKTRRRLHKLCREMDAIYRRPVYEHISRDLNQIGLNQVCRNNPPTNSSFGFRSSTSFSDRIPVVCRGLSSSLRGKSSEMLFTGSSYEGLLSRTEHFCLRMKFLGGRMSCSDSSKMDLAIQGTLQLRSAIKGRVSDLRSAEPHTLQVKKRGVVELFRALQKLGLSPYNSQLNERTEPAACFSTPSPSRYAEFDSLADELFNICIRQVRRLYEVSDSRARHTDISREDASKSVSFCYQLFDQVCSQRISLRRVFDTFACISEQMSALEYHSELSSNDEVGKWEFDASGLARLQDHFQRLRSILEDLRIVDLILNSAESSSNALDIQSWNSSGLPNRSRTLLNHLNSECNGEVKLISKRIRYCVTLICAIFEDEFVIRLVNAKPKNWVFLDGYMGLVCEKSALRLRELLESMRALLTEMEILGPSNVLSVVLRPIVIFLADCEAEVEAAAAVGGTASPAGADGRIVLIDNTIQNMQNEANILIERILIATQRLLSWADVNMDAKPDGLQATNDQVNSNESFTPNSIKSSHNMLLCLEPTSELKFISLSLSKNNDHLETLAESLQFLSSSQRKKILQLQNNLGHFVRSFFSSVLWPCLEKCALFHCHSLSLLRTLSSLFVGLCQEGFCRPAQEEAFEEEVDQNVDGTGFGDVGDGDLSGAQNVSNEVEDEEQLSGLQDNPDSKEDRSNQQANADEDGFEMRNDFEGDLEDAPDMENDKEGDEGEDEAEAEKHISGDDEKGKDIIDERLWGEDDQKAKGEATCDKNDKSSGDMQKDQSDLVAKDDKTLETDQRNNEPRKSEQDTALPKSFDDENAEESGNTAHGNENEIEASDSESAETPSKKKGSDGKPVDDGDEDREDGSAKELDSGECNSEESDELAQPDGEGFREDAIDSKLDADTNQDENSDIGNLSQPENQPELKDNSNEDNAEVDEAMVGELGSGLPTELVDEEVEGDNVEDEDVEMGDFSNLEEQESDIDNIDKDDGDSGREGGDDIDAENAADNIGQQQDGNIEDDLSKAAETTAGTATTMQLGDERERLGELSAFQAAGNSKIDLEPTADQRALSEKLPSGNTGSNNGGGDGNDNAGEDLYEAGKSHSRGDMGRDAETMQDVNPLRSAVDSKFVKEWEKCLNIIENEKEGLDDGIGQTPGESKAWEFINGERNDVDDKVTLGPATEDQHMPLAPTDRIEDDEMDEKSNARHDSADEEENDTDQVEKSIRRHKTESGGTCIENEDIAEDKSGRNSGNDQLSVNSDEQNVREHPARRAVEGLDVANDQGPIGGLSCNQQIELARGDDDILDVEMVLDSAITVHDPSKDIDESGDSSKWVMETLNIEEACNLWRQLDSKVSESASILCEQLRLVLEPTMTSGLGGGYRSGKRLNMRKVIEYVASDFQKDRIWLRRVKADKRSYDVMIAIDDSASMLECNAGVMALESVALVLSAMGKLEVGRVSVTSFGKNTRVVRDFDEALPLSVERGAQLLRHFTFSQRETDVVNLLQFVFAKMVDDRGQRGSSGGGDVSLVFIISDGRLSHREEVKRKVRQLKAVNVLVAFIIVDGNDSTVDDGQWNSIFDVKRVEYDPDGNLKVSPYMEDFPIAFYVVVQDLRRLPIVLAQSLRHWMEMTTF